MKQYPGIGKIITAFALIFWLVLAMGSSFAGDIGLEKAENLDTIEKVQEKIDEINNRLTNIGDISPGQVTQKAGVSIAEFEKRLLGLRMLRSAYERLLYSISALDIIQKESLAVRERYDTFHTKGMMKKPPYTLTFLDSIYEEQSGIERNLENIDSTMMILRRELPADKEKFQTLEKGMRRVTDELAGAGIEKSNFLKWRNDTIEIQFRELQATIRAKENEIQRYETEKKLATLQLGLLKEQIGFVRSHLAFDSEDLGRQLSAIQDKRADIQSEMDRLRVEQKKVEKKRVKAREDFEKTDSDDARALSESYLKAREEWHKTYQVALELNERTMLLMDRQAAAWQKRYALVRGGMPIDELKKLREDIKGKIDNISQILQIQQNYLAGLQKQIATIEAQVENDEILPSIKQNLAIQLTAARKRLDRRLSYQSAILATDTIEKRLLAELEIQMGQSTIQDHLSGIKEEFVDFWNIEIWAVNNQPVTLRKMAVAFVILILGMVASKYILSIVRNRFLLRSQFKETTASAVHKIMSYTAYLLVFLFALRMVNIPLTAFAFLGGAVAIGIGFGAQNLINNFISGFMILGERPINIGDLIEVDGVLGMVEEIGARCTRIRTGENIHILVPNSTFLEKNIINWTHSNKQIRTKVTIGVAYGSPVKIVHEKLIQAVSEVPSVLKAPAPFVLFSDFGDNALIFNVYFWIEIKRVIERHISESNVRYKIDELFAEQGLVIAFPQRDVHLDTLKPLQISIEQSEKKE